MYVSPLAPAALLAFPLVCGVLYSQLSLEKATAYSLIGAVLFLPQGVEFNLPLIPPLHKHSISVLAVYLAVSLKLKRTKQKPSFAIGLGTALLLLGVLGTVLTNQDELQVGPGMVRGGLGIGDLITMAWNLVVGILLPFSIGRRVYTTRDSAIALLKVIVALGIVYGFLMLIEIRLSPQLNRWIYGYFQHDFRQTKRGGGYRPMVFMSHGLTATLFCLMSAFAALTLKSVQERVYQLSTGLWAGFLVVVLLLSNSMGVAIYCLFGAPLLLLENRKLTSIFVGFLAGAALLVPTLRLTGSVPMDGIVDYFMGVDLDRALSLAFRFDMEEGLMEKCRLRPLFGYGGFGRSNLRDANGENVSTPDSQWIIAMSYRGLFGLWGEFLIYTTPVFAARRCLRQIKDSPLSPIILGLAMMVSVSAFELLINSRSNCMLPLFAGALLGLSQSVPPSKLR